MGFLKSKLKNIVPKKLWSLLWFLKNYAPNEYSVRKKNVAKKCKINIIFIIQFPEMWNSIKTVYEAAVEIERINPIIFCIPKPKTNGENEAYEYIYSLGIECIEAYDSEKKAWFDLKQLSPDYIMYTRPYDEQYPDCYRSRELRKIARLCYIPYAFNMLDGDVFDLTFNKNFIKNITYTFTPNLSRLELCMEKYYWPEKFGINKFVFLGYPRFDIITQNSKKKISDSYIVAWLPRWTSGDTLGFQKKSHFMQYHKPLLEYANENPDIQLIIRPHPLMFSNFIEKGIMKEFEVKEIISFCGQNHNISFDMNKDYLPLLQSADLLLADYTSLLIEFFITGKPIIYCDNAYGLNKEGCLMDSVLYHAASVNELIGEIEKVRNENDPMFYERKEIIDKIMPLKPGGIGKSIINFIVDDYLNL